LGHSIIPNKITMVVVTKKKALLKNQMGPQEQQWNNPINPEKGGDERIIEQLKRQKKEVERNNQNLTNKNQNTKNQKLT